MTNHHTHSKRVLYENLIESIPAQSMVRDCLVGLRWTLIQSEGTGMALTPPDGHFTSALAGTLKGRPVRELAELALSWNPLEAAIGVAAINSFHNSPEAFKRTWNCSLENQPKGNSFEHYQERFQGKKVAVIGHFPGLDEIADKCELTILERRPQQGDLPDPAAEYVLPEQDFVFITGMTLINKTLPRLLELSQQAFTVVVGPSTPLTPLLFSHGVDALAGSVMTDTARAWRHVAEGGERDVFKHGVHMVKLEKGMEKTAWSKS